MKRLIILALAFLASNFAYAQKTVIPKRLESNIMIGAGLFGETGNGANDVFPVEEKIKRN